MSDIETLRRELELARATASGTAMLAEDLQAEVGRLSSLNVSLADHNQRLASRNSVLSTELEHWKRMYMEREEELAAGGKNADSN